MLERSRRQLNIIHIYLQNDLAFSKRGPFETQSKDFESNNLSLKSTFEKTFFFFLKFDFFFAFFVSLPLTVIFASAQLAYKPGPASTEVEHLLHKILRPRDHGSIPAEAIFSDPINSQYV